ncbi:hypothetical protein B0T10DRAFT_610143 [Thelonectria olida]|uniref:Uncharacterized protein n=1 Tax=Thelonectria olida TaxID=1576542 RepID=A0A9P8VUH1_9HYPO|nr:hypothetical protein B0T10DRAFT_610143 [Thelonectria olida]
MCRQPQVIFKCTCHKARLEEEIPTPFDGPLVRYGDLIVEPCDVCIETGYPCPLDKIEPHPVHSQAVSSLCADCMATCYGPLDPIVEMNWAEAWAVKHNLMKVRDEAGFERDEYRVRPEVAKKLNQSKNLNVNRQNSVIKKPKEDNSLHLPKHMNAINESNDGDKPAGKSVKPSVLSKAFVWLKRSASKKNKLRNEQGLTLEPSF